MEEAIITGLAALALAGMTFMIGYAIATGRQVEKNNELRVTNAEYRMELEERSRRIEELLEKNREFMKQLNAKQENVSRETSYNKSYGIPEVVDWINSQYPPSQEDKN